MYSCVIYSSIHLNNLFCGLIYFYIDIKITYSSIFILFLFKHLYLAYSYTQSLDMNKNSLDYLQENLNTNIIKYVNHGYLFLSIQIYYQREIEGARIVWVHQIVLSRLLYLQNVIMHKKRIREFI